MSTNTDFSTYTGRVRVAGISFDSLIYKFEGQTDMYDPADRKTMCQYVGKVGTVDSDSFNHYPGTGDTVEIKFSNGYSMIVNTDGLVATDEDETSADFLPDFEKSKKSQFRVLTDEEKKFADLAILSMIQGRIDFDDESVIINAISLTMRRSKDYACEWTEPKDD